MTPEDSEQFIYLDNRFFWWMRANELEDADPREMLDEQLLKSVQPLNAAEMLEYAELVRLSKQETVSRETNEKFDIYSLRLDTLLEVTSSVLAKSIPELLAQLVFDLT